MPDFAVAYSGGADSTALLHALAAIRPRPAVRALHVDHGLHADARTWSARCAEQASALGVECRVLKAKVGAADIRRRGVEAAARSARYALLAAAMRDGECLVTAQHREDQLETILLQLVRGAGLPGLAAMPPLTRFGPGRLVRPLLAHGRAELRDYLERQGVAWIEDPANRDPRYDRSFLRTEVLPLIRERWPAADTNGARSARHLAEGASLLEQLAAADLAACDAGEGRLDNGRLRRLPAARQRNALRHWLRSAGRPSPDTRHLGRLVDEVVGGRGGQAALRLGPSLVRRYRDRLYLLDADQSPLPEQPLPLTPGRPLELPSELGRLTLVRDAAGGLDPRLVARGCEVRFRDGGERIEPGRGRPRRRLKDLFREAGIVPWMRGRIPLVYCGDRLVAVADLWLAADCVCAGGWRPAWEDGPPLY